MEVSAQEAVYIVLQLPMRKASQQVVFINTSPPSERVNLIKPLSDRLPIVKTSIYKSTQPVLKPYPSRLELDTVNLPLRTEFPVFWEFLGIPKNSQKFPSMQISSDFKSLELLGISGKGRLQFVRTWNS